jgi:hypothetical protein
VIAHVHGDFTNPETRAYGDSGLPKQTCYLVAFDQPGVWSPYHGPVGDRIYADVFEHWLEEAE